MNALILVNGEVRDECIEAGINALRQGATAIDAAELVARGVEADVRDHSVGFSGLPNILGEVELDASIMEGATLASGAVSALKGYLHPISVARQVMERLPHVLLTDAGAARFAAEIKAEAGDLLDDESRTIYLKRLNAVGSHWGLKIRDWSEISNLQSLISSRNVPLIELVIRAMRYHEGGDTMNVVVRDAAGHIVSAVTTSGMAWKYPGRIGDSPNIGAGQYADDRHGAAACTGAGELTIRHATSVRAVLAMAHGLDIDQAGRDTIRDLRRLSDPTDGWVRLLLMDRDGKVGGYCTHAGSTLKVQSVDSPTPTKIVCEHVV
ncbi:MAG TPA: isoaspartyl peptidase/L-asparaginase [Anaerolineae bacterium]|jgi:isoaspartyl peptidase/L-asparaginase-like protein (Ntn-hydrolase superfamily)